MMGHVLDGSFYNKTEPAIACKLHGGLLWPNSSRLHSLLIKSNQSNQIYCATIIRQFYNQNKHIELMEQSH